MTTKQAVSILKKYNKWRRGDSRIKMPEPAKIGEAIDIVIEQLELMDELVKLARQQRLNNNDSPF
jgi:hypothetical protein